MEDERYPGSVSITVASGCLVAHVPAVLQDETIRLLQRDVLDAVHKTGTKGVILDLSGVRILDSFLATGIVNTVRMLSFMGAAPVLAGIRPEVAASIVFMDIDVNGLRFAFDLDEAYKMLAPVAVAEEEAEGKEGEEEEGMKVEHRTSNFEWERKNSNPEPLNP